MPAFRTLIAAACVVGTLAAAPPGLAADPAPAPAGDAPAAGERGELLRFADDTWRSLGAMAHPGGLPADRLLRDAGGRWVPASHTSPSDIAAYLWSVVAAEELRVIDGAEAGDRLRETLDAVGQLGRAHGFFFNWYDARTGGRLETWPVGGGKVRPFLSAVDNGWLAAALMVVGNARPELHDRAEALLGPMDFRFFYDPYDPADPAAHPGQLRVGYFDDTAAFTRSFYGMLNSEARIASYIGIARGQLPAEHYYRLHRTLPPDHDWQGQTPAGEVRTYGGVPVFEGHYTYRGLRLVPTWGGSMFEALMVTLFVPEGRWAPQSWGVNHPLYVRAQREYGLSDLGCGSWGFSPARGPQRRYGEYGVGPIATKPGGYPAGDIEAEGGGAAAGASGKGRLHAVIAPYASFLALRFARSEALANLRGLARRPAAYGRYGFADSVDVGCDKVSDAILAVDQGMIMAAVANALDDDVMQDHFGRGPVEAAVRPLIAPERFTAAAASDDVATAPRQPEGGSPTGAAPPGRPEPAAGGRAGQSLQPPDPGGP
jgi:hypothetical protein